jgi:hypothetical protein
MRGDLKKRTNANSEKLACVDLRFCLFPSYSCDRKRSEHTTAKARKRVVTNCPWEANYGAGALADLDVNCRLVKSPAFWTPTRFASSKQKGSHLHSALIAQLMHWFLRCYFSLSLQLRQTQVRRLTAAGEYKPFVKILSSNGTKLAELQTKIQEFVF